MDTATQGEEPLLPQITADFFSPGRVLFGSDCTMEATAGRAYTRDTVRSAQGLSHPPRAEVTIFAGNARRVLKVS